MIVFAWFLRHRRRKADQELDAEQPSWSLQTKRTAQLALRAVQVAADVPDDAEAVAAVKADGGKPQDYKRAAALIRADRYRYEHRNDRRAARLLQAAGDGGPVITASSDEEALFRAVDNLEALPIEDAFAVLAAQVPSLRALEHQVITSQSAPGWRERDADDRMDEILENLDRLVGPEARTGSLFIRSAVAHGHARVHLLGKAGLLRDDAISDSAERADLLAALARGYGVAPDVKRVAKAIRKRVGDRNGFPTLAVLSLLLQEPGIGARLRSGAGPSGSSRTAMMKLLDSNAPRLSSADFVDSVVDEVRSTLIRVSGSISDDWTLPSCLCLGTAIRGWHR